MTDSDGITELVRKLYPYAHSIASRDGDRAIEVFVSELDFRVHEWRCGLEHNGWRIPPAWNVRKALVRKDGEIVFDGRRSPLGVAWLSPSFRGTVDLPTLRRHAYWSDTLPDATVYHWGALYRPTQCEWGLCIPKSILDRLPEGQYEIDLETETDEHTSMKVLDHVLPGTLSDTVVINAHNCHPFQANDDLSGCAVGIRLLQRLARIPERRLTYRLVIAPELVGTSLWLDAPGVDLTAMRGAMLLKAVGNPGALRLQESYSGNSRIDLAARHVLGLRHPGYERGPFRTIYGNDETVFEAPGFEIPTISLTRMPFPEYHTDADTPDRLSEPHLEDAVETSLGICLALEEDRAHQACFRGLVSLSNPRYDLYKPAPAPGIDRTAYTETMGRWHLLMNCLPRQLDGRTTTLEIAIRHGLPVDEVAAYVRRWVECGLARPAGTLV